MRTKKFLRRNWREYSRLGRGRKKLLKWRRPRGRHNKMREKRAGYPATVSIGYGNKRDERGKVNGMAPVMIYNSKDLLKVEKGGAIRLASIGKKKKIELIKLAGEKGIKILNANKKLNLVEAEKKK